MSQLPFELIQVIIEWALYLYYAERHQRFNPINFWFSSPPRDSSELWRLSHICRRWRFWIFATPHFWKYIEFPIHIDIERFTRELELANDQCIDITFVARYVSNRKPNLFGETMISITPSIGTLLQDTHRWRSVTICDEPFLMSRVILNEHNYHALEKLSIHFIHQPEELEIFDEPIVLQAPRLLEVDFRGAYNGSVVVPWHQLLRASLEFGPEFEDVEDILSSLNLERLERLRIFGPLPLTDIYDPINLPGLRVFEWYSSRRCRKLSPPQRLGFEIPDVENLYVCTTDWNDWDTLPPSLPPPRISQVTELHLQQCDNFDHDFRTFLPHFPHLTTLRYDNLGGWFYEIDELLCALTLSGTNTVTLCPNLVKVSFTYVALTPGLLYRMLASRKGVCKQAKVYDAKRRVSAAGFDIQATLSALGVQVDICDVVDRPVTSWSDISGINRSN